MKLVLVIIAFVAILALGPVIETATDVLETALATRDAAIVAAGGIAK